MESGKKKTSYNVKNCMQVKTVNFCGNPHFRYLPLPKFSLRETTLKYSETSQ